MHMEMMFSLVTEEGWGLVLYVVQTSFLCREESAHKIDLGIVSIALVTESAAS